MARRRRYQKRTVLQRRRLDNAFFLG